jgi:hypothetical protein
VILHQRLKLFEQVDGVGDGRADERLRAGPPQPEFDLLAIDQDEPAVQRECGVRDDQVQANGLAGARFTAGEQISFGQSHMDGVTVFINAEMYRLPD